MCDDRKIKMKGISKSQSKNIKFEEYKKCLDREEYQQECDNFIIRSTNHEKGLQKVKKNRHYLFSMINDAMKIILKVNHGVNNKKRL